MREKILYFRPFNGLTLHIRLSILDCPLSNFGEQNLIGEKLFGIET